MTQTTILILIAVAVVLIAAILLLRSRKQHVGFDATTSVPRAATPAAPAPAKPVVVPAPAPTADEGHGVDSEMTAAIEDVIDQFIGIDAHPSGQPAARAHGDPLTRIKGLGPKAASLLDGLGVTTFAQIAAWDDGDVAAIDAQMGAFKGRVTRDRWVEQARLLAKGDTDAFEAEFGKLGG
jgi:predicted flap endonuclease-1-like 5' DNA nuclease